VTLWSRAQVAGIVLVMAVALVLVGASAARWLALLQGVFEP